MAKLKAYFSYWNGGYFNWKKDAFSLEEKINNDKLKDPFIMDTFRIAISRAKKHYGEAHLITDAYSEQIFKELPFDTITTGLERLSSEYTATWSLGKLYAYKIIALKGDPFIHIDNDVFLWKALPEKVTNAKIFAQSREPVDLFRYNLKNFYRKCPKKYLASEVPILKFAPNVGVVGGSDLSFFYNYSSSALNMILDPENKDYWTSHNGLVSWRKAVIAEQYYMGIAAKYYNKKIEYIFPTNEEFSKIADLGYTHLMGAKYGFFIKEKIHFLRERIA